MKVVSFLECHSCWKKGQELGRCVRSKKGLGEITQTTYKKEQSNKNQMNEDEVAICINISYKKTYQMLQRGK